MVGPLFVEMVLFQNSGVAEISDRNAVLGVNVVVKPESSLIRAATVEQDPETPAR
jgi:hypothetical protein